ncbi:FAD-dependent thymidylate synthase [Occallatibacter savannae]|uniref:FAD-dependent thymidylate synthase n=1 Tax=Occallatibacter savannae TaxID=1002691 RepID=UPI000D69D6DB|nr:FAD-dependent thymidylate synthase [Occallatibacter savannae]
MSSESFLPAGAHNQTDVYAVHGADPEVLAYAMAKYSRSALSMRESLAEISAQRAEQFLNTFYFQYGHRSIADLAHIALAVERLSLLAAIVLVDEQRWDGQERSTRYQNFQKSGWYFPDFGPDSASAQLYTQTIDKLFSTYQQVTAAVHDALKQRVACPETMKPDAYDRTLKARAFDVARYLLPLATNTSLGQIVNARTLETQVSRLLSHPVAEVRDLGKKLRDAATSPAWNVNAKSGAAFVQKLEAFGLSSLHDFSRAESGPVGNGALAPEGNLAAEAATLLNREVRTAPTLVKYAEPNTYLTQTRAEIEQAASEILKGIEPASAPVVDLVERTESLEVELAATLLYWGSHHPYRQIRDIVAGLPASRVSEIIEIGLRHRGKHDEALRVFHAGAALRFDILMDIGGFRDMHRHRRVTQIQQGFTARHGYDTPHSGDIAGLEEAGVLSEYQHAIESAHSASVKIAAGSAPEAAQSALYLLPLATRVRCLFKMDFAEAQYISELRSGPAGHFSYRNVAWEMYLALQRQHPSLAKYIRATDYTKPIDLLQR